MKYLALAACILCGITLIIVTGDFPDWGDPNSPASSHLSPHYIEKTYEETSVPNIVTAVLGDYRGYDTMFETVVVFCAGTACFFLLGGFVHTRSKIQNLRHRETGVVLRCKPGAYKLMEDNSAFDMIDPTWVPYDLITSTCGRLLVPFIQLFGLYVIAHGHHSPGGGFQGGVILGASFILLALSYNLRTLTSRFSHKLLGIFSAVGVIIYAGVGVMAMFYGGNFLDYSVLGNLMGVDPIAARSLSILYVEIGVGFTVMSAMIIIYNNISSMGSYEEGL